MTPTLFDLYVVTHTHWDREWYHTAERFRQRLVRLVDEVLDDPPPAGESFLLDGQAIVLEDYLAVRPERAAEVNTMLRERRLEAGPWYVLADELIPSGEALVRNLLIGRDVVQRLRGQAPPVLYCPDSFGHPAILPDLAAGFGCSLIVLWRGYRGTHDMVRWFGAAGSSVLTYHLPPDGYEFGSSLPTDPGNASRRWAAMSGVLAPRAVTGAAILLHGADHHARQRDHTAALSALAATASPVRVHAASIATAARALVHASAHASVPDVAGELRDSYGYTWTLQGTLGTRAAQKRRNAMAERCLVRDVEPWIALCADGGDVASRALLAAAWRTLLQAHPHDTLCGTSVDAVADAFDSRLASVHRQATGLRDDAVESLAGHDRERARADAAWRPAVLLRNPVARARGGIVELTLRATLADIAVGPGSGARQGERRRAPAWGVEGIPLQVLAQREHVALTESPRAYPDADVVVEADAVGWVDPLDGYVVDTRLHGARARVGPRRVVVGPRSLDNGRLRIGIAENGEVMLDDLERSRRITNVVSLERARDVGDLYTPAVRERLPIGPPRRIRVVHRGPLRGEIGVEYPVSSGRAGDCRVSLQLDAGSRALRVIVRGDNRSLDQRLRLRVATGLTDSSTVADAAFLPVVRTPLIVDPAASAMEHVVPTAPLHRWVARFAGGVGAALVSDGLAEYESTADGSILVTLVRSVGELSRADLPERPGHAGWPATVPGAQCIGPYEAHFAIQLFGDDAPDVRDEIEHFAEDVLLPITGETLRSNLADARRSRGLELIGDGLSFSAAMPARRDGWIVVRCVNLRDAAVEGSWRVGRGIGEAVRARLDETPVGALDVVRNVVRFHAAPREIVTILVR